MKQIQLSLSLLVILYSGTFSIASSQHLNAHKAESWWRLQRLMKIVRTKRAGGNSGSRMSRLKKIREELLLGLQPSEQT